MPPAPCWPSRCGGPGRPVAAYDAVTAVRPRGIERRRSITMMVEAEGLAAIGEMRQAEGLLERVVTAVGADEAWRLRRGAPSRLEWPAPGWAARPVERIRRLSGRGSPGGGGDGLRNRGPGERGPGADAGPAPRPAHRGGRDRAPGAHPRAPAQRGAFGTVRRPSPSGGPRARGLRRLRSRRAYLRSRAPHGTHPGPGQARWRAARAGGGDRRTPGAEGSQGHRPAHAVGAPRDGRDSTTRSTPASTSMPDWSSSSPQVRWPPSR